MPRSAVFLALLMLAGIAAAHHSFAVFFDEAKSVSVTGVVQDYQFRNPHGVVVLAVEKDGKEIIWKAETNSPSVLRRRGWTPDSLKVGETITIEGWPARDGSNYLRLRKATRANGEQVGQSLSQSN